MYSKKIFMCSDIEFLVRERRLIERWSRFPGQFGGLAKVDSGFRLRRQFLCLQFSNIDLVGRPATEGRVRSIGVVVADPATNAGSCLTAGLEGIEEHAFVFE